MISKTALKLFQLNKRRSLSDSLEQLSSEVPCDWEGRPILSPPKVFVGKTRSELFFGGRVPGYDNERLGAYGEFKSGLWEGNVLEIFLETRDGYLEFNVSPSGAWWGATFSEYRKQTGVFDSLRVHTEVNSDECSWSSMLVVEIATLNLPAKWRGHLAGIFGSDPRTYFTSSGKITGGLDFHLAENFVQFETITEKL